LRGRVEVALDAGRGELADDHDLVPVDVDLGRSLVPLVGEPAGKPGADVVGGWRYVVAAGPGRASVASSSVHGVLLVFAVITPLHALAAVPRPVRRGLTRSEKRPPFRITGP